MKLKILFRFQYYRFFDRILVYLYEFELRNYLKFIWLNQKQTQRADNSIKEIQILLVFKYGLLLVKIILTPT